MPQTRGKFATDPYSVAEKGGWIPIKRSGADHALRLSTDEAMYSRNTATLHQLGVLLLSLSPFLPAKNTDADKNRFINTHHTCPDSTFSHVSNVYLTLVHCCFLSKCLSMSCLYYVISWINEKTVQASVSSEPKHELKTVTSS